MVESARVLAERARTLPLPKYKSRYIIALLIVSFIALAIFVATHTSTYSIAFIQTSSQPDVQRQGTTTASAKASTTNTPAGNASRALIRIAQADIHQYANQAEHDQWWASACSTTSMTEVINAYGYHYRVTDILNVEKRVGAITPESGLLHDNGIDQTAIWFGFETTTLSNPSVDQVVSIANQGQPVIVSFPPPTWAGGHLLVVRGGNSTSIQLADSSNYNLQTVTRTYFLRYWRGFAKVLSPSRYLLTNKPTVTVANINNILTAYHSPAAGQGQMIYNTAVKYGLDPAYIIATFAHESQFGTHGEATKSKSPGNLRCIQGARCEDGYAQFDSWQAGFEALSSLLAGPLYAKDGRIVPETIIPRFAPATDNNDEAAYITALKHTMDVLRAGGSRI